MMISRPDDGAAAYQEDVPFVRANFQENAAGTFEMPDHPVNVRLEIWNWTGGWYGARFALYIGTRKAATWVVDEGPAFPRPVAWDHEFAITPG